MNWGHKILIVIILFLAAMLGMVFYAMQQENEMIDDHYYQKELEYQSVINAKTNLLRVSDHKIVQQDLDEVKIIFPDGTFEKLENGTIELLRTNDQSKDVVIPLKHTGFSHHLIEKSILTRGMYKARIRWVNDGVPYYAEETLFVQ